MISLLSKNSINSLISVNSLNFKEWNSNWNIAFFNLLLNLKLAFLNLGFKFINVAIVGLHNFIQFMKAMEYWDFWVLLTFIFYRKVRRESDCKGTQIHNVLVCKQTLKHLAKLAKWFNSVVNTYLYGGFYFMFLSCHARMSGLIYL